MSSFYVSMVFLGVLLVILSLAWIALDRKNAVGFLKNCDEKKEELVGIMNDAEQMIEELNKFSDYIVTQMDVKNEELRTNLRKAEEEIRSLAVKARDSRSSKPEPKAPPKAEIMTEHQEEVKPVRAVNGGSIDVVSMPSEPLFKYNSDLVIDQMDFEPTALKAGTASRAPVRKAPEKVIPINSRHREVLLLAQNGMSDVEIAKRLNMGKGEIQLILDLNK